MSKPKKENNIIRCGLVGLGGFGKHYLRLLKEVDGVMLRVVASRETASFEVHKNSLAGIKTTTDALDIFSDKEIDAVFIVTPPATHFALIEAGLKAGKHVFVEKPMVLSVADARRVKTSIEESDKTFMVGYQYLFNKNIRYLKSEIGKRTFGKILSVKSEHAVSPSRPDVDIFWDVAPHPLSVFQYLFEPTKLIEAEGKIEHDDAFVKVCFDNAPMLEITATCFGDKKVRKLTIIGDKAVAVLDETLKKDKLTITKEGKTYYPKTDAKEPLKSELEYFIHCIQINSAPFTGIDFGFQITKWLEIISKNLA